MTAGGFDFGLCKSAVLLDCQSPNGNADPTDTIGTSHKPIPPPTPHVLPASTVAVSLEELVEATKEDSVLVRVADMIKKNRFEKDDNVKPFLNIGMSCRFRNLG